MKKMMIMALAILTAAVSQAVGVQWNANGMGEYAGATAYLIKGETKNGETTLDAGTAVTAVTDLLKAGTSDLSSVAWGNSAELNAAGAVSLSAAKTGATFDYSGDGTDTVSAYLAIVTAADEKGNYQYLITSTKSVTATSNTGSKTFAFGSQANATWETYTASGSGGGGYDPIIPDVPEPTSMALLALGAAAFGLRRKLRK